jgi:hypothetical protein
MNHEAKIRLLAKAVIHAAAAAGLSQMPAIMSAMKMMRDAVRDPNLSKRIEDELIMAMTGEQMPAVRTLLRAAVWIVRSARLHSTALAELSIPRLCAESVRLAELDWQEKVISEISKAEAA